MHEFLNSQNLNQNLNTIQHQRQAQAMTQNFVTATSTPMIQGQHFKSGSKLALGGQQNNRKHSGKQQYATIQQYNPQHNYLQTFQNQQVKPPLPIKTIEEIYSTKNASRVTTPSANF